MTPKKKSIALKFSTFKNKNREKTNSESKIQEESNSESGDEEDMGSLAKKKKIYRHFRNKKRSNDKQDKSFDNKNKPKLTSSKSKSKDIECYNCKGYGHLATDCKKGKIKKKGLVANPTRDDTAESESKSDHEGSGIYSVLMASTTFNF